MKHLIFVLAAAAMGAALCPAAAMTTPAAASAAAATAITLKPAAGPPATAVRVHGTGFSPGETVMVDFDTTPAATAVTSAAGSFTIPFTVPAPALPGRHTMTATGQSSNLPATAIFLVRTNWARFHFNDRNSGFNPYENVLSPANVAGLTKAWSYPTGAISHSSPAVADGVVYVGSGGYTPARRMATSTHSTCEQDNESPRGSAHVDGPLAAKGSLPARRQASGPSDPVERLGQDRGTVGVGAPFLHVRQVRLVGLTARRIRGVGLVPAGRESAPGAVPGLRDRRVRREARPCLMVVRAPERHAYPRRCLAAFRLTHGPRADAAPPDGIATTH